MSNLAAGRLPASAGQGVERRRERRRRLLRLLARLRLIRPAYRACELIQGGALRRYPVTPALRRDAGAVPLPSRRHRILVTGSADPEHFLRLGAEHNALIREAVAAVGRPVTEMEAILDFGCGCACVTRHWLDLPDLTVVGSDCNPTYIKWLRRNLPSMEFSQNALEPPLSLPAESMDLVYARSVFTHLPGNLQRPWLAELRRVLKPSGLLWFTTQGESYLPEVSTENGAAFEEDSLVEIHEFMPGSNLCSVVHPGAYVEGLIVDGYELVSHDPGPPPPDPRPARQDSWLVRRS